MDVVSSLLGCHVFATAESFKVDVVQKPLCDTSLSKYIMFLI